MVMSNVDLKLFTIATKEDERRIRGAYIFSTTIPCNDNCDTYIHFVIDSSRTQPTSEDRTQVQHILESRAKTFDCVPYGILIYCNDELPLTKIYRKKKNGKHTEGEGTLFPTQGSELSVSSRLRHLTNVLVHIHSNSRRL